MKCVIIDDEPKAIEIIARYVEKLPELRLLATFDRPLEALTWLKNNRPDCIFLDINMPDLNGLQLSTLVGDIPIVFTTAYPQYALESYEVSAADYLLKPISFPRFLKAVEKVKALSKPDEQVGNVTVSIKSGTKIYLMALNEIDHLETFGNDIIFHTKDQKIVSRLTIKSLEGLLPMQQFVQIHKSFLVPKDKFKIIENHQVTTKAGARLPIGAAYREKMVALIKQGY